MPDNSTNKKVYPTNAVTAKSLLNSTPKIPFNDPYKGSMNLSQGILDSLVAGSLRKGVPPEILASQAIQESAFGAETGAGKDPNNVMQIIKWMPNNPDRYNSPLQENISEAAKMLLHKTVPSQNWGKGIIDYNGSPEKNTYGKQVSARAAKMLPLIDASKQRLTKAGVGTNYEPQKIRGKVLNEPVNFSHDILQ